MHFNGRRSHRIAARMNPDELASIQAQASKDAAARQSALSAGQTVGPPTSTHNYPGAPSTTKPAAAATTAPTTSSAAAVAASKAPASSKVIDSADPVSPTSAAADTKSSASPTAKVHAPPAVHSSSSTSDTTAAADSTTSSNTPSPVVASTEEKEAASSSEPTTTARSPVSTVSASSASTGSEDVLASLSSSSETDDLSSSSVTQSSSANPQLSSSVMTTSPTSTTAKAYKPQQVASSAAATQSSESSGLSGGAVAGIVIAVLLGVAAVGIIGAWFMRQKRRQEREVNNPWNRMQNPSDDNITPFPRYTEKPDDYYGDEAPVIGSNRALALARQNAFYADGTPRPDSTAMNPNFAGYGAGRSYGPYPTAGQPQYDSRGQQYAGQQYQDNPFNDQYQYQDDAQLVQLHDQSGPRQLVGPGGAYAAPMPVPAPVPLGRPEAPQTYDDIAEAEAYADDRYADDHLASPQSSMPSAVPTGAAMHQDAQYAQHDAQYSPQHQHQDAQYSPQQHQDARLIDTSSEEQHMPEPMPLPQLRPMSPLMPLVDVEPHAPGASNLGTAAPVTAHHSIGTDEMDAMYNEVATYAGVPQPQGVQEASRVAPQPYVHGQPLAPLAELATPKSEVASLPPAQATPQVQQSQPRALPTPPQQAQAPHDAEDAYGGI